MSDTKKKSKQQRILEIRQQLEADWESLPLVSSMAETVPGDGNAEAEIMFIGEAAGRNELIQRRPFVGQAGKLLQKELEKLGLKREDIYISNVVKARPPDNRDPLPEEIEAYRPYLDDEIEAIDPVVIVTLGRFSMGKFIPGVKISQVNGRLHKVHFRGKDRFVLPFFHPAAALRQGVFMEKFMADFQKLPKIVEYIKNKKTDQETIDTVHEALF